MRSDIHFSALHAARKIAFSVALPVAVLDCGGSVRSSAIGETVEGGPGESNAIANAPPAAAEKDAHLTETPSPPKPAPEGAADAGPDASDASDKCPTTLAAAFPTPGGYTTTPVAQSKEVVACCDAELATKETSTPYRWDCCVAYDPDANGSAPFGLSPHDLMLSNKHAMACTPWGPPVPPRMNRRRHADAVA